MFINPSVIKSKDGKVILLSLQITNFTEHNTMIGSPNLIGVPEKISFLLNGEKPIVLQIQSGNSEWSDHISYNSVMHYASSDIVESGIAIISLEQYEEIISSENIAVQLQGAKRTATYEAKDISESFIPNLDAFYKQYLM